MANTVIALKKSATPAAQPSALANGELAINFADGKLFYKHANGTILPFNTQGGNAFGTINANGTLVVAGTSEAVVSLIAGNNITITGDAINDTITINATSDSNVAEGAFDKANAANYYTYLVDSNTTAAFAKANSALANTSGVTFAGNLNITGNVGIGTSSPTTKLDVVGNITSSNTMFAVHFDNVSDITYKENIQPIANSMNILSELNPISFDWKNTKSRSYGLIAQEVEKILPTIVHQKPDGTKTINYIEIIAFLIQAIKEQQKQIDDINTHINNAE